MGKHPRNIVQKVGISRSRFAPLQAALSKLSASPLIFSMGLDGW